MGVSEKKRNIKTQPAEQAQKTAMLKCERICQAKRAALSTWWIICCKLALCWLRADFNKRRKECKRHGMEHPRHPITVCLLLWYICTVQGTLHSVCWAVWRRRPEMMAVLQQLVFPRRKRRLSRSALPEYGPSVDFYLRWLHLFWQSHPFPEKQLSWLFINICCSVESLHWESLWAPASCCLDPVKLFLGKFLVLRAWGFRNIFWLHFFLSRFHQHYFY